MTNPQLLDYVRQQVAAGVSKDAIKKALATQGWNEQDISETFSTIERPAPVSVAQSTVQTSTVAISQPISVQPKKSFKSLIVLGIVVLVLILGAGSAYAFFKLNPSTFAWLNKSQPVENITASVNVNEIYAMYCGDGVPALPSVKSAIDIKTAKYDQVKAAIDNAVSNSDTEQLGLLYYSLSRYLAEYQNSVNFKRTPAFSAQGLTPAQLSSLFNLAATSTKPFQKQWLDQVAALISTSTPLQTLFSDLAAGNAKNVGLVLGIAGYRDITEENKFDEGLPFVKCAAEHYYDDLAMYHLGEIYRWGSDQQRIKDILKSAPNSGLENSFPEIFLASTSLLLDNKQSLFWAGATEALDPIKHQVFTDANYEFGWNNIGRLDTIVNTGVLTGPEMQQVDCQIGVFLAKRYSDLGDSTATCEVSTTSIETISSYMHTVRNDVVTQFNISNLKDLKDFPLGSCKKLAGSVFDSDRVIDDIKTAAGGDASKGTCIATGMDFAVSVPLPSAPGNSWCVDGNGGMKQIKGSVISTTCK